MSVSLLIKELAEKNIRLKLNGNKLSVDAPKGALTPLLKKALMRNKNLLVEYLYEAHEGTVIPQSIKSNNSGSKRLSFAQQRLWLLDKIDGGSAHYNMPGSLRLTGDLDVSALTKAMNTVLERHESLRTCFSEDSGGQPLQIIQSASPLEIPLSDISLLPVGEREFDLAEIVTAEARKPFDLSSDLMLRAQLVKVENHAHVLLVTMHHIASDGWSMTILINEFSALYQAYVQGKNNPLPELAIQYADYAQWQRDWLQGEVLDAQLGYWKTQLAALPVVHSLPLDKARPKIQTFNGASHHSLVSASNSDKLNTLCQGVGGTLFMGLHAAFSVLLSRYSNETDIVMGSPIANREQAEVASLIGFFVNTLVLRCDLSSNPSFTELLKQSQATLLDAYAHQQVPFEQIVEVLQPERSMEYSPLFQVMLVLQNNEGGTLELPGLTLSQVAQSGDIAKYDLTLNIVETPQGLQLSWEYNTDLFNQNTIARLAQHFELLLTGLVNTPDENVFVIDMLSPEETHQQLVEWNDTQADFPKDKCIHALFEEQVNANPDAIAVVFEETQLTYGELNAKANQLAHYLIEERQVTPDTLVGICVERSLEMIVGIMGILKAGGAYVPLDPSYPAARLAYMLEDANLTTVLTQAQLKGETSVSDDQAIFIDSDSMLAKLARYSTSNPSIHTLTSRHLAYVIYTSGSTGNPKGVMIEHASAVNMSKSQISLFNIDMSSRVLGFSSLSFDAGVSEWTTALLKGAALYICNEQERTSVKTLEVLLINKRISHATLPPAILQFIQPGLDYTLTSLIVAGESCDVDLIAQWAGKYAMYNAYGPTETAVCASLARVRPNEVVHIGRGIANVGLYILSGSGTVVPIGCAGELHIGGAGLARGYLNQPELTAEKFIPNPYFDASNPSSSTRLYKTGDLVRYLPDGNLEFLGRIDHQVKIRGFRIELGEIEQQLLSHSDVNDAVVVALSNDDGDKRLVAYVTHDEANAMLSEGDESQVLRSMLIDSLRQHLSQDLPDYMVPSAFVVLEHLPLTSNGKIDRKGLPAPDMSSQQKAYVAPTTDTENVLCEIWQEVLGLEQVGITDNFFELGGHSLLATSLVANINTRLGIDSPLKLLFSNPTIATLASALAELAPGQGRPDITRVSREQDLQPSFAQQRLWLLDKIDGGSAHYNMPGALRLTGDLDVSALTQAMNTVIERHESLRTYFAEDSGGQPLQVIQNASPLEIPLSDISLLPEGERACDLAEIVTAEARKPFDLSSDVMLRAQLIKVENQVHVLLVTMHHIASDGWSMTILINEFSALYDAYVQGKNNPLPDLAIQYADYAQWQRDWLQGEVLDAQLGYWTTQLAALPVVHSLPLDKARPKIQTFNGASHHSIVSVSNSDKLNALCQGVGGTLFMGLHAAFSVLLSRYSNETDIVIGSPIANREQAEVASLIGFFVNTLVLRCDLSDTPSFTELLKQSKATLLDAYAHQQVPFEQIVEVLQPERSTAHSPLFQVMLVLQNNEEGTLELPGLTLSQVAQSGDVAKYDLTLNVVETPQGLQLSWEYNTDLFNQNTITRLATHFELLLTGLVNTPDENVFVIDMLSKEETHQQLVEWNDTQADFPKDTCIHELFEQQVKANPDAIAVVFEETQLTYGELNAKANQLAHYLIEERQVTPDTLVGICVERSLEMIVGIMGILKAGGAYVPLDPSYPAARLAYMLEDANLTTVLTQAQLKGETPVSDDHAIVIDSESMLAKLARYATSNPSIQTLTSRHLAYVIYTSGSTGNPKGVMIEHASVNNVSCNVNNWDFIHSNSQFGGVASYSFDASIQGITQLQRGGALNILPDEYKKDPLLLADNLSAIDVLDCTPSVVESWFSAGIEANLPNLIIGGDEIKKGLWDKLVVWQKKYNKKVVNVYGPTEATVNSTEVWVSGVTPSIGGLQGNVYGLNLSVSGVLCPLGSPGELHIGGAGLARGYLNQPELTAEKFIPNPYFNASNPNSSERLYKTGDLVRYLPDGNLEFLGRIDHQVKIRGFRIELGEIEQQLLSHSEVNDAVVVALSHDEGDKRLVAYVTHDDANAMLSESDESQVLRSTFIDSLREQLSQDLPDYMVPSAFVVLDHLPLTPNGKIDRKGLPAPDMSSQQKAYVAPTTDTEKLLCEVWQEVLGVAQVGITDNFFALGGHSLLATRLVANINTRLGIDSPLKLLFSNPTIATFASALAEFAPGQGRPDITPVSREQDLQPSFAQQRLWLLDKIDGGSAHYNMPGALRLTGDLDVSALTQAMNTVIERHESLRTYFAEDSSGQPLQVIQNASPLEIPLSDISLLPVGEREFDLAEIVTAEARKPFDLSADLMLRTQLVKVENHAHVLLVTMHHIASDGWSMTILINEFSALYQAYVQGKNNPLPELAIQYADYAQWQRDWLQGEVLDAQLGYWKTQLAALPVVHSLPLDKARPKIQTFNGASHHSVVSLSNSDKLSTLCQGVGGTLFMGFHAAFSVLLSRYSNETDIVMGSPIANREQAEVASLIGFFVNTLVLRCDLSNNPSFTELLKQSKATLLDAYAHQQVPFEQIVEVIQPERSMAHSPLFQVMLVLQNNEGGTLELPGLTLSQVAQSGDIAKYDLTLNVVETPQGLQLSWEYNTDLFNQNTITRLAKHFELLLTGLVNTPDENVFAIDMLSKEETHQQLVEWNDTQADFPKDTCIHELFEQQVKANPDAIAVVFEETQLTYGELNAKANQLAHYLIEERQVTPDTLVGICVERSLEMIVGIMGILKAGGAYVPLDPSYPEARLAYMLGDAGLDTIIVNNNMNGSRAIHSAQSLCLDDVLIQEQIFSQPCDDFERHALGLRSNHLAYLIYTSGSAGKPKGVMVEHSNVISLVVNVGYVPLSRGTVMLQNAPITFDAATFELWGALLNGGRLVIQPERLLTMSKLSDILENSNINTAWMTSGLFDQFVSSCGGELPHLEYLLVGGDVVNKKSVKKIKSLNPNLSVVNGYGPTENTTFSCSYLIDTDENEKASIPIGRPVSNRHVYVLGVASKTYTLTPVGAVGELYLGGDGLARGYLNDPELMAEKFIQNPFSGDPADRLYKTGDLVRYLPDGNLEFLGRIDHQVKIRGFRIELGEIEQQLLSHRDVNEAVVVALSHDEGDKRLVAYVTHDDANAMLSEGDESQVLRSTLIESLREQLSQDLPDYMVPSAFVVLDHLPLTPNGKIDRKGLPAPDMSSQQKVYVAPTTDTEKLLCEVWQEVLGLAQVGITDNFFALGGHSLLATSLVANINTRLGIDSPLKLLFSNPTIATFASALAELAPGQGRPDITRVSRAQDLQPSFAQQRLWLLDKIDGGSAHYNMPGALRLTGDLDVSALTQAMNTVIERHESLRTYFAEDSGGQPLQVIQNASPLEIPLSDISLLPEGERACDLAEIVTAEARKPFDLSSDVMLRAQLIKVENQVHVLLVTMHHIASDGWSMTILINEFSALYQAYVQGKNNPLPALAIQYADYAQWQRDWLQGEVLDAQLGYWTTQLAALPVVHSVPLDTARPKIQTFNGASHHSIVSVSNSDKLNALCQGVGGTLFMGLHAAFSVLLSRYSNETDIVMGSPIANREQAEVASLIGFFVNTLVLRCDLSDTPSFTELLKQSKATLLDAYAHQQVPFEQIVEVLQPERSTAHSPLFQVMLVLQNNEEGTLELPGLTLSQVAQSGDIAKYDLTLNVVETPQGLQLSWEYNTDLFNQNTITRLAKHFELLLTGLVNTPDENVFAIDMLSKEETHQQLVEWNDTQADFPKDTCIHELFEQQVKANPDAIAVVFEETQLTYGELNAKANQLAHYLIEERHVTPDTLVGICVERSLEMIVGIMGILKAGGAYVPLDPSYPAARLAYMLDDANLTTVLTQAELKGETPVSDDHAIVIDSESMLAKLARYSTSNPRIQTLTSRHLAYVIYTSGSTGNPKGVMIEHSNTNALIAWASQYYGANDLENVLASTSICFDLSVFEFFAPLSVGGRVTIVQNILDLPLLKGSGDITLINTVPSAIESLLTKENSYLYCNALNLAGELLKQSLVDKLYEAGVRSVYDLYGPSEDTTYSTSVEREAFGVTSIGKPVTNTQCYALTSGLVMSPPGVAGELHIGGEGLARGYLNQPELTAEKFIPNPFFDASNPSSSTRLYKTGDLVRYLPDGNLEFLGRIDHQVKIRGFRIELGEIEQQLLSHSDVNDAVVVALSNDEGDKRLVAYVTHDDANAMLSEGDESQVLRSTFIDSLREQLSQDLPDYMVPSAFIVLEHLPLTPNGKIDRKGLPAPDMSSQQKSYVAPTTDTEKLLCEIWQDVLGLAQVGITDNFFALGGHSLLVMNVIAKAQQVGVSINVKDFFAYPQISMLAHALDKNKGTALPAFIVPKNLIPTECQHVTPEMLPLISLTQKEIDHIAAQVPGGADNIADIYPLGPLQEGILFAHRVSDKVDPYVLSTLFEINAKRIVDDLIESLQFSVNRHDVLRTAILWEGLSQPTQVVCKEAELPVTWLEFDDGVDVKHHMQTLALPENQWLALTQAPLIKLSVAKGDNKEQYFVLVQYHHIISDHVALEIILHELSAFSAGQLDSLPPTVPYRNFIAHTLHQAKENDAQAYFTDLLGDIDEPTAPFGLVDVQGDGTKTIELKQAVPEKIASDIRELSKSLKLSPASLFHGAYGLVIAACSGRDDVVFGSVMSGRLQGIVGSESMLGVFINTLPIRLNMNEVSVFDFVLNTQQGLRDLLPFEQASLALTQSCSGLSNGVPLFSAMLNYRHSQVAEGANEASNNDESLTIVGGQERTNYPFTLSVDDFWRGFELDFQVDSSVDVERVMSYMQTALARLVECLRHQPEKPVAELSVLPENEIQQQLVEWNDTQADFPKDQCIHELFEQQVNAHPDAIAVVFEETQLTYGELNAKANQLAHYLIEERQVTPDTLVGICVERSLEMIVGIMGILKAGGAYVPLDPSYPEARLAYMLDDANLTTVLTQAQLKGETPVSDEHAIVIDSDSMLAKLARYSTSNPSIQTLSSSHLAYVIYTSGSTGNPKGVMIEHASAVNMSKSQISLFNIDMSSRVLGFASLSFDAGVWEWVMALLKGAALYICNEQERTSAKTLEVLLINKRISHATLPPAILQFIQPGLDYTLTSLIVAGESCDVDLIAQWAGKYAMYNAYGPTETAVCASLARVRPNEVVHIGRGIANVGLYILSGSGTVVPIGCAGELHIGGAGLARGYLNQPELTTEKFIPNLFFDASNPSSSTRLYKTGDLVRYLPDGNLEFLGRIDHQVKIRGFRIELGEIEQQLLSHSDVNEAVVIALSNDEGDKRLVAYVTHDEANAMLSERDESQVLRSTLIESLREQLSQDLPDYMVPSAFVVLENLPLTPNGKIDRKGLSAPDMSSQQKVYVAPTTDTEKHLCEIWQEVLGLAQVGITDNFFALGGHSLLATRLVALINEKLHIGLMLQDLFSANTIEDLTRKCTAASFKGDEDSINPRHVKILKSELKEIEL